MEREREREIGGGGGRRMLVSVYMHRCLSACGVCE